MITVYLICLVLGIVLCLLSAFSGLGHVHVGHLHLGHVHSGHIHSGKLPAHVAGPQAKAAGPQVPAFNGFTVTAFLAWFGAAGYLLASNSRLAGPLVLLIALVVGGGGAAMLYSLLFRFLLPRERVLTVEDTRMEGTIASVSNEVRALDGIGEIIFSQNGARRASAARSEDGSLIERGTEVVVLRYERGIAYVRPLHGPAWELSSRPASDLPAELSSKLSPDSTSTHL